MFKKLINLLLGLIIALTLFVTCLVAIAVLTAYPKLPTLKAVTHYNPKMPLTIYSADGKLIGIYGEERRSFTKIDVFPTVLKNAVVAAEDKRFYQHMGIDPIGISRAILANLSAGGIQSGASTITQQVARNFFLTNEKTYTRKFNEALLAYKIEHSLTKEQILELYFNQIYLGQRSYGFAAASYAYFNKPVQEINLAEAAILAGLPKAPSAFNPIVNPKRAKDRQIYILNNMLELGMINQTQYDEAVAYPLQYQRRTIHVDDNSLYVAEMARQSMYEKFGEDAYSQGFRVYTTVSTANQKAATAALRKALDNFGRGKRFVGAENWVDMDKWEADEVDEKATQYLSYFHTVNHKVPALVMNIDGKKSVTLRIKDVEEPITLSGKQLNLIRQAINNDKMKSRQVRRGSVVRIQQNKKGQWYLTQVPELQGAIVSIDPKTGAILALVGGYDFYQKEFNRATQAWRQPGSTFKPFIYSAALSRGMTATTLINDAPLSFPGLGPGGKEWVPQNSDGRFAGYMTLHQALVASRNIISIRILMAIDVNYAHQYLQRFGFDGKKQPKSLSLALGSGSVTPLQMAEGYAVFANGGAKVPAYLIDRIYDGRGQLRAKTEPKIAGKNAPQAIDARNAFIMYKIMQDVTRYGTASRAAALKRPDIAGKTGTTNDQKDGWFVGFNPQVVTAVFMGFDKPRSMGRAGYGGKIALPVWMDYMRYALKGKPIASMPRPRGIVQNGDEYYYQEWQSTNPDLPLDNGGEEILINGMTIEEMMMGDEPLTPINTPSGSPQPAPQGNRKPTKTFDSLF